jgi:hypothetical protein
MIVFAAGCAVAGLVLAVIMGLAMRVVWQDASKA